MDLLIRIPTILVLGALLFFVLVYATTSRNWFRGVTGRVIMGIAFFGALTILLGNWNHVLPVVIIQAISKAILASLIIASAISIERGQVRAYRAEQERLAQNA